VFANIVGILGGLLIAWLMLDIAPITYHNQTSGAVGMNDWAVGLVKSVLFGAVVAIVGCWRGMRSQRSAAAAAAASLLAMLHNRRRQWRKGLTIKVPTLSGP